MDSIGPEFMDKLRYVIFFTLSFPMISLVCLILFGDAYAAEENNKQLKAFKLDSPKEFDIDGQRYISWLDFPLRYENWAGFAEKHQLQYKEEAKKETLESEGPTGCNHSPSCLLYIPYYLYLKTVHAMDDSLMHEIKFTHQENELSILYSKDTGHFHSIKTPEKLDPVLFKSLNTFFLFLPSQKNLVREKTIEIILESKLHENNELSAQDVLYRDLKSLVGSEDLLKEYLVPNYFSGSFRAMFISRHCSLAKEASVISAVSESLDLHAANALLKCLNSSYFSVGGGDISTNKKFYNDKLLRYSWNKICEEGNSDVQHLSSRSVVRFGNSKEYENYNILPVHAFMQELIVATRYAHFMAEPIVKNCHFPDATILYKHFVKNEDISKEDYKHPRMQNCWHRLLCYRCVTRSRDWGL